MDVSSRFSSLLTMNTSLSVSPFSVSAWLASPIFSALSWMETDFLITKVDIGGRDLEYREYEILAISDPLEHLGNSQN